MSRAAAHITATYADGRPLSALQSLIAKRCQILGETAKDAVTATAINILTSLRAGTPLANEAKVFVSVQAVPSLYAGWRRVPGQKPHRCLRQGSANGTIYQSPFVNAAGKFFKGETPQVFRINEHFNDRTTARSIFVIAHDRAHAVEVARRRAVRRLRASRGLARTALSIAMGRTSTRSAPAFDTRTGRARAVALGAAVVRKSGSGFDTGSYAVEVGINLAYSAAALKGGPALVQTAMMRAANRTAGILRNHLQRFPLTVEAPPTPFPEIAKG